MKASPKRLVIDTSTPYLYLGLFEGTKIGLEVYHLGENDHSVTMMDKLSTMFTTLAMRPIDIDEIIVGIGPGSYTGLRIGVVVAKMLGWSLHVPVFTVSSLALMASSVDVPGDVLAYIDARRDYAFLGLYRVENNRLSCLQSDRYTHFETYKQTVDSSVHFLCEGKPDMEKLFDGPLIEPVKDIHLLSPVYLRDTEAETNLKQSSRK